MYLTEVKFDMLQVPEICIENKQTKECVVLHF